MKQFRDESSYPKVNAQRNLDGITHYVEDSTLRFHKSRILKANATVDGLLFYIIESYAADYQGKTRLFRPVIFDIAGNTISRPDLENGFKTRAQAEKHLWAEMDKLDRVAVSMEAIDRAEKNAKYAFDLAREMVAKAVQS